MSRKPTSSSESLYTCKVRLLRDEDSVTVTFQKQVTGEWLLDYVCKELNVVEKYYFGLRVRNPSGHRKWLDLVKPVLKQVRDLSKDLICFRVRYYPSQPSKVHEEITRYHLFLQLRRDLFHGRLVPRPSDVPLLCALIMQSDLGDYNDVEVDSGFTSDLDLIPKLATSMEDKILNTFKDISGLSIAEAEEKFLDKVLPLDTYGVDPIPAKEKDGDSVHIGVNSVGVSVFQSFRRIKLYKWENLLKASWEGKYIILTVHYPELEKHLKKQTSKYKCPNESTAKFLWKTIHDQRAFFTLHSHGDAKLVKTGSLFRSQTFKFSGRCEEEVVSDSSKILRMPPEFVRASSASLNRSTSIRASTRNLRPTSTLNRHSTIGMETVSHSQSLPIGITDILNSDVTSSTSLDANVSVNMCSLPIEEEVGRTSQSKTPHSVSSSITELPHSTSNSFTEGKGKHQKDISSDGECKEFDLTPEPNDSEMQTNSQRTPSPENLQWCEAESELPPAIDVEKHTEMVYATVDVVGVSEVDVGGGGDADQSILFHDQYVSTISPPTIPPEIIVSENIDSQATEPPLTAKLVNGTCVQFPTHAQTDLTEPPAGEFLAQTESHPEIIKDSDTRSDSEDSSKSEAEDRDCLEEPIRAQLTSELESIQPESVNTTYSADSSSSNIASTIILSVIGLLLLLLVFVIVVFEWNTDNLEIAKIRYSHIMQAIENGWYRPIRQTVVKYLQEAV